MQQQVSKSLKRLNYITGQLLTAESFQTEQTYYLSRQRRHNRWLHGVGVVTGLQVSLDRTGRQVMIQPGGAIDCAGNELIVETACTFDLRTAASTLFLALEHQEQLIEPSPLPGSGAVDQLVYTRIEEYTLARLYPRDPQPHRITPGQAGTTCGEAHPLVVAVLQKTRRGWQLQP